MILLKKDIKNILFHIQNIIKIKLNLQKMLKILAFVKVIILLKKKRIIHLAYLI